MSLGMKDDVIARALGVSRRTIQQDISDISALLGARTRFQIALFAQQRGGGCRTDRSQDLVAVAATA